MAERLRAFDFTKPSEITASEKASYPWDEWFDGDIWKITQGEDFDPHPLMMERIIRTRITARKGKVRMRHLTGENALVFQRTDLDGPAALKRATAAAKRAERKRLAEKEAAATLKAAGITPAKAAKKVNGHKAPSKKATPSKRPAKVA